MNAPQVRKGYCLELWPICHAVPWMKYPDFEVPLYLDKFAFSCGRELHHEPTVLFPDMLSGGGKAKCRPERHA